MNYLTLIDLLSACGVACVLINLENTVIAVNEAADALLEGEGQLPGQRLPESLIPIVRALREGKSPELPLTAGTGRGIAFMASDSSKEIPGPYARLGFGRYVTCTALLRHPLLPGDTRLLVLRSASRDHALDMTITALDQIHEAVVICDEEDRMYFCNRAALEIDDLVSGGVRGSHIDDIYENEDNSPLSIPLARASRTPSLDHRQFYHTKSGLRRETISNFFPVLRGGDALGAFSVVEDWDTASSLQRRVIDLQDKLLRCEQQLADLAASSGRKAAESAGPANDKAEPSAAGDSLEKVLRAQHSFDDFVQNSAVARSTVRQCREAAASDQPILLYGENGSGKHFLAQSIHSAGRRARQPFLQFSCASLPHVLLEAMIFGTVRNAYPEAEDKKGLLEQAENGTLYLADIDAMQPSLQRRLLRVLQSGGFSRMGDNRQIRANVSFILSLSLTPDKAIEDQKLDTSLYSFLQHRCIMVPPLRGRRADIIPLTMDFVNASNRRYNKRVVTVSDSVFALFRKYRWPGNIKELKHAVEYAVRALPEGADLLTSEYLPTRISHIKKASAPVSSPDAVVFSRLVDSESIKDTVTEIRRQSIYQALLRNGGNITRTAAEMGLSRQNLQYHIRQCGIDLSEIRAAARKK